MQEKRPSARRAAPAPTAKPVGRPRTGAREAIVAAAVGEFAQEGFGGARIERISKGANTSDRMLYYHFESKEALFLAALEKVHEDIIEAVSRIELRQLDPRDGMKRFIAFLWRYYQEHPEFISLVNSENLHGARHVRDSKRIRGSSGALLSVLEDLMSRGVAAGHFRRDVTITEVHLTIVSLCYYYLSNSATMSHFLGFDMLQAEAKDAWLGYISRLVLDFLGERVG
ncbi:MULTISPECIES: TetR family transcriptional regulator [Xenophilus]|uniref:TetR family transcriptional regulator n=1 Tax=Xenophilus TaxID=151754 RepID=UPI000A053DBB|nr:TetR family transcriptional regulator [Xenophilus azovorans]